MQIISRSQAREYCFDAQKEAVLRVRQGEPFKVETEDAYSGDIRSREDLLRFQTFPWAKTTPRLSNPMGGPVYVEGADKGDILAVHIDSIIVEGIGRTTWMPFQGPLGESKRWPELSEAHFQTIQHIPGPSGTTRDGRGILNERISWNLRPFIGTIGVAPEVEVATSSVGQGPWGGNLDCRDINEGTTVFLPVFNAGGLLFVGDVHASQGDTEFYGTADETRAEVTLTCNVIKAKRIPFLRLEKADSIISVFCFRPLEVAVESAIVNLMEWMIDDYHIAPSEAYLHMSINPDFRVHVYQMVRVESIQYTVGAEIPKRYL